MTGHINVMFVLQSCTDSLQVMAGSSTDTFSSPSDCACDLGNIKVEEDIDMQEEGEVDVKTENIIFNEEEECIDIKDEEGIYTKEEGEDVYIKEEVS